MSALPPSYDTAIHQPGQHDQQQPPAHGQQHHHQHVAAFEEDWSSSSDESDSGHARVPGTKTKRRQPTKEEIEERMSIDDEERELPEGWTRCFDKESGHAFYVDTRSKPPRSIWQHPYDDPTYLQSLPDTHPANPNSTEAKQAKAKYDEMMDKARKEREMKQQEKRSAGGKLKDKLLGSTKAEREEKRRRKAALRAKQEEEERKARQKYLERRAALMKQQGLGGDSYLYARDPYAYSRPSYPYSRYGGGYGGGMYGGSMYGPRYGYGGGVGMPLGGGYGYGRMGGGMGM
ncbi:hypothetical protein FFLO_05810 [Filobasidium floriforme]|uniref:WW domain-containing protein n=2 Tax=Filobasidium floriforme TaxID=5210 RepID=A0A8K0NR25_9TREE|nr:hypothetical protein FFLO_05810 [Filobasidium floriforme]